MGKKLVIKGADFSANGISPDFTILRYIKANNASQTIMSAVPFPANGVVVAEIASDEPLVGAILGYFQPQTPGPGMLRVEGYVGQNVNGGNPCTLTYVNSTSLPQVQGVIKFLPSVTADFKVLEVSRDMASFDNASVIPPVAATEKPIPFGLFGYAGYNTAVALGLKLKSIKMFADKNKETLLVDAIPVKKESDGKVCLYDKVSGQYLYTTNGSNPDFAE